MNIIEILAALRAAPPALSRRQAAQVTGVTERTIDRWIRDGSVTSRTTARGRSRIYIDRDSLIELMSGRHDTST